jgi:hypothetical protein
VASDKKKKKKAQKKARNERKGRKHIAKCIKLLKDLK